MPVRVFITHGTAADCKYAEQLIDAIDADFLFADRAYDTNAIIKLATDANMKTVIPPKKNRKVKHDYDEHLYKLRHLVENAFLYLKQ
jgi:transposase